MAWRSLSHNVWAYIIALTPQGVRHLISPWWLEEMYFFSLSPSGLHAGRTPDPSFRSQVYGERSRWTTSFLIRL